MKQISQEEFEQYVEAIIRGDMSRTQVVKELQTEARTLNNRIHELADTNPKLYSRYVAKITYMPKERKDLDAMQLAIEILAQGKTIGQIVEERQTGRKTIQRRIKTLEHSKNPIERRTFELCREATRLNSRGSKRSQEFEKMVQMLLEEIELEEWGEVKSKESNIDEKEAQLLELERKYHGLCLTMPKGEAAKALGYTPNQIFKSLNKLYQIRIERTAKTQGRDFRQELKAEVDGISREKREIELVEGETQKEEERE